MDLNAFWQLAIVDAEKALKPGGILNFDHADLSDLPDLYLAMAKRNFLSLTGSMMVQARMAMAEEPSKNERFHLLTTDRDDDAAYFVERSVEALWEANGVKVLASYSYDAHPAHDEPLHNPTVVIVSDDQAIVLPISSDGTSGLSRFQAFISEVRTQLDMRFDLSKKLTSDDDQSLHRSDRDFAGQIHQYREDAKDAVMTPATFRAEDPSMLKIVEHDLAEIEAAALARSIDVGPLEYALEAAYSQLSIMQWIMGDPEQASRLRALTRTATTDRAAKSEKFREVEITQAMAMGFDAEGDIAQARLLYEQALTGYREVGGPRNQQVLETLEIFGDFQHRTGEYEAAVALLVEHARLKYGEPGENREGIRAWLKVCEAMKNVSDPDGPVSIATQLAKSIPLDPMNATASDLAEHCLILEGTTEAFIGTDDVELAEIFSREAIVAGIAAVQAERREGIVGEEDAILLGSHEQLIEILKITSRDDEAVATTRDYLRVAQQFNVKESVSAAKQLLEGFDFPGPTFS